MTSHAAVVARGMGKPCVSGCQSIEVDAHKETATLPDGKVWRFRKYGEVFVRFGASQTPCSQNVDSFRLPFNRSTRS